jgi:hypothetical protein
LYEEIYQLVENTNLSYQDVWNMPVEIRHWWIDRKNKDLESKGPNPTPNVPPGAQPRGKTFIPPGPAADIFGKR